MNRNYRAEPYPVSPETERAIRNGEQAEQRRARGRRMRELASLAQAAIAGAHGPVARALAEEGIDQSQRGHVAALARWAEAIGRDLEADEKRAIRAAIDAWNLEHALAVVCREVRKEIAQTNQKERAKR